MTAAKLCARFGPSLNRAQKGSANYTGRLFVPRPIAEEGWEGHPTADPNGPLA